MKLKIFYVVLLILMLSQFSTSLAQEQPADEYWKKLTDRLNKIELIYYKFIHAMNSSNEEQGSPSLTAQVWLSGSKWRKESNVNLKNNFNAIVIFRPDGNFIKKFGSEVFEYIGRSELPKLVDELTSAFPGGSYENATYKFVGQETIDNEVTTVIERTTPYGKTSFTDTLWISNDKQLPIKHKHQWAHAKGMFTITEFKNYSFDPIPEVTFDVGNNWVDGQQKLYQEIKKIQSKVEEKSNTSGEPKPDISYTSGEKQGLERIYYKNGKLWAETSWINGKRHGTYKEFNEDGSLKQKGEYANDIQIGKQFTYYPNGKIKFEAEFENGKEKTLKNFTKEGNLDEETIVDGDNAIINMYHNNGKLSSKRIIEDGKPIKFEEYDIEGNLIPE